MQSSTTRRKKATDQHQRGSEIAHVAACSRSRRTCDIPRKARGGAALALIQTLRMTRALRFEKKGHQ